MTYTIENELLTAEIRPLGAELCSLQLKRNQVELIWQGDAAVWGRQSPILFPFVGKLKDDTYTHEGASYSLPQHGFARDKEFSVELVRKDQIVFVLREDEDTLENYPFGFNLFVSYELKDARLVVSYRVENKTPSEMYFSIGAHPAFRCPLQPNQRRADYSLEFEQAETSSTHRLTQGNFSGATEEVLNNARTLEITDHLFDQDALVFKGLESSSVSLLHQSDRVLSFHFEGFPYFGIWSKSPEAEFVCLEPWFGLADHENFRGELKDKEGIQQLVSGESFECAFSVEVHG